MNKKGKQMSNVWTYLIILFIFAILMFGIKQLGLELTQNPNQNLDNDSIEYIAELNEIDLSEYQVSSDLIESPILFTDNTSQGNPKDYSLEFQFAKERGLPIENTIKNIFSVPSVIVYQVLKMPRNNWSWIVDALNWFWRLAIIVALVYFARGIVS